MKTDKIKRTIILLHFAGGNCYSFQFLKPYLDGYNVLVLELPGRGKRVQEPLIRDKARAVDDLVAQFLERQIQGECIIYGHSMGATLALLLCEKLESRGIYPTHIIASGCSGPGVGEKKETYKLTGESFKNALRKLGGISETVLQEEELFEYFEPVIRADFELLERDTKEPNVLLRASIHAVMGSEEDDVSNIENWHRFTTASVTTAVWNGDHFFIHHHPERLARLLKNCSEELQHQDQNSDAIVAESA